MSNTNSKLKALKKDLEVILKGIDLESKKKELYILEADSISPEFWKNSGTAKKIMKEIGILKSEVDEIENVKQGVETLLLLSKETNLADEFNKEIGKLGKQIKELKLKSFLSDVYDYKNAIISIHAGQGGTEAMDWSSMLYRMYLRYCEKQKWVTDVLDISEGEEAGIKSVTFKVEGKYAYGYLKNESGTHRLVRQSPFNADNLRQTSFALVEVLPELEEVDLPDIQLKDDDLEWQFFRASSQGGQNVQKVSTAVRLKHKPTEIVVTAQTERYQEQNRKIALNLLRAKLWLFEQKKAEDKIEKIKGEYRPASWGNQIRSYVLHPYKMVKDLRTNIETSNAEAVLDGELHEFIQAELQLGSK